MSKKKLSLSEMGDVRKPERVEPVSKPAPTPTPKRGRGRPAERSTFVQLNTRVTLETSQKIDTIIERTGMTQRDVIEHAVAMMERDI
jgi:hypothetical protein